MAPKFTICIPSWNRGQAALSQVLYTLPLIESDWEILVLDNCSSNSLEGYSEIASLSESDQRVRYIRHAENLGFHGNLVACFNLANSDYIQIIADEDYGNPKVVRDAIATLDEFPHVGLIRGSIAAIEGMKPRNSAIYPDQFLESGVPALSMFSMTTNYMSGIIYNKRLLISKNILQKMIIGLSNTPVLNLYPHMYLDILVAASCAVITSHEIVCFEGEEFSTMPDLRSMAQNGAYSWGSRLEQFIGFRDAYVEVCGFDELNDLSLLIYLYLNLVTKYYSLFYIDSFLYTVRSLNIDDLRESLRCYFHAATGIDEFASVRSEIRDWVDERFQKVIEVYGNRA